MFLRGDYKQIECLWVFKDRQTVEEENAWFGEVYRQLGRVDMSTLILFKGLA